jgi:hypothetical protein
VTGEEEMEGTEVPGEEEDRRDPDLGPSPVDGETELDALVRMYTHLGGLGAGDYSRMTELLIRFYNECGLFKK